MSAERVSPDSDVKVTVTVTNHGDSLEEVLLEDMLPVGLTVRSDALSALRGSRHLLRLPKGASYTFDYTVTGSRGGYTFEALRVKANDHLAVNSSTVRVEAKGRLFILPPLMRISHIAIRPRRTRVYAGSIPARAGGSGTEFFGVRDYQAG